MKNSFRDKGGACVPSVKFLTSFMQRDVDIKPNPLSLGQAGRSFFFSAHNFTDQFWPGAWDLFLLTSLFAGSPGVVDQAEERPGVTHRRTDNVRERRAFPGNSFPPQRGLDSSNKIRSTEGCWIVPVPSIHPSTHEYISVPRGCW